MNLLTLARDLRRRRARERTLMFVAEGVRTVEELLASPLAGALVGALVSPRLAGTSRGAALAARLTALGPATEVTEVTESELAGVADTESPQGILAIARQPERSFGDLNHVRRVVVLDGVQDPGNVGTILRASLAFGAGIVALPGTVDLWNPKVVRGAMGALFTVPAVAAPLAALVAHARATHTALWIADGVGQPVDSLAPRAPERLAIVVGNEGGGVSPALAEVADCTVAIPTRAVESLNVAVATGILLYALRP